MSWSICELYKGGCCFVVWGWWVVVLLEGWVLVLRWWKMVIGMIFRKGGCCGIKFCFLGLIVGFYVEVIFMRIIISICCVVVVLVVLYLFIFVEVLFV